MKYASRDKKEMKDSGVDWIDSTSSYWKIGRIGNHFQFLNKKVSDKDFEPLSVTYNGVKPRVENAAKSDNGENRKLLHAGNLAINGRSDRMGAAGMSPLDGSVSLIYHVLEPFNENIHTKFYHYLIRSNLFSQEFYKWGRGIVADLWTTRSSEMKQIQIPIPPFEEQEHAASFLDEKTGVIDEVVKKKKKQIELLKEKRAALITQAVTKGLDQNVKMKDSGAEWIGEIPEGWEVKKLGHIGVFLKGGHVSKSELTDQGLPVLLYGDIYTQYDIQTNSFRHTTDHDTALKATKVRTGDLLMTGSGETPEDIGKCIVYLGEDKAYAGGDVIILRQNKISSLFLSYQQNSSLIRTEKAKLAKGQIVVHIYPSQLKNIPAIIPPIEVQHEIVKFLNEKTALIDTAINKIEYSISLIREYRSSLISHAVTGKIRLG